MKRLTIGIVWLALILASGASWGATITVNPGSSIQSGINSAAAGDTILVKDSDGDAATPQVYSGQVILDRAVTLRGENKGVTIAATAAMDRSDLVSIRSGNCTVDTFTLQGGWQSIGTRNGDYTMYASVKLLNLDIRGKPAFGILFFGDGWLIQFIDINGINSRGTNTAAYMRGWGRNHILRDIDMYGTNIPDDLRPSSGTDFAHLDGLQTWNQNGEIFENILMERIILTDFVQGTFLGNEVGDSRAYNGFTLRDFVFWGTNFSSGGSNNLLGSPSHGAYAGKWGTVRNFLYEYGLIYSCANYMTFARLKDQLITRFNILTGDSSSDCTTYAWEGMSSAQIALVARQNLDWNTGWDGGTASPNDTTNIDPQIGRPAQGQRTIDFLRGPDGKSFTADDGWIPKNPAAAAFGPRVSGGTTPPPPTNLPPTANAGPDPAPIQLAAGQTSVGVTLAGSGTDPDGTIDAYLWDGPLAYDPFDVQAPSLVLEAGVYVFTLTVRDDDGALSAPDSVTYTVRAFVPTADVVPPTITLEGSLAITLPFGMAYVEPGYSATDDRDGTVPVTVSGTVNSQVAATYTLTYTARDAALNTTVRTRTVTVQAAPNTPPAVTIAPVAPVTLNTGETSRQITVTATGTDAQGPVTYQWANGPATASWTASLAAGTHRRTVTVTDTGGLTASAFVDVVVNPAPVTPPPTDDMATQAELDAAVAALNATINALRAEMILADSNERTARINADNALGARIDNLPAPSTEAQIKLWIDAAIEAQPTVTVVGVSE